MAHLHHGAAGVKPSCRKSTQRATGTALLLRGADRPLLQIQVLRRLQAKLIPGLDRTKTMPAFVPAAPQLTPVSFIRVRQPGMTTNPRWRGWIAGRSEHALWLLTTEPWHLTFKVSDDKRILVLGASVEFMNSLADAHLLQILSENREPLASLDLKDSDSAIKAVSNCVTEHPLSRTPTPEPAD